MKKLIKVQEELPKVNKKKTIAMLTLLVLILQMFSPFGALRSVVNAAFDPDNDILAAVIASDVENSSSGNKIIKVTYAITAERTTGIDFSIKYDPTKIKPARVNTGAECTIANISGAPTSCGTWGDAQYFLDQDIKTLNTSSNTIRIIMTEPSGGEVDLAENGYSAADLGADAHGYDYYLPIITLHFYLVDTSITQLSTDMLSWSPVGNGNPNGFKFMYQKSGSTYAVINPARVSYNNMDLGAKTATKLTVVTKPTNLTYTNGEALDFTGGKIKVDYDDGTSEEIDMTTELANGNLTVDSAFASQSSKNVTISYGGKSVVMSYYMLSSISLESNPSRTTYDHGDTLNYAGATLNATYTNSSGETQTKVINVTEGLANGSITSDLTTADVANTAATITYGGKVTTIPFTVNDPLDHLLLTTPPNKVTYNHSETIDFTGAVITTVTKSGATATIASDNSGITLSDNVADIAKVNTKWTKPDGLEAGTQPIAVNYQGKTVDYNITVNDTIDSIEVTTQPTANNKYGVTTPNFAGLKVTVNTVGGGSFTVDEASVGIDISSYNPNTTNEQSFTVTYGGQTAPTKAKISLKDYVTGITANFPKTTFDYNTPLNDVVSNATYEENYASGAIGTTKPITIDMVSGYNKSPNAGLLGTSHSYTHNITINYNVRNNPFDILPATTTQSITVKDVLTGIIMDNLPSQQNFDYGETFAANNGRVKEVYVSGATGNVISMADSRITLTQTDGGVINMSPAASEFSNGVANKTIMVTYTYGGDTYTTTYPIVINDKVTSISIQTQPTKTFTHGGTFTTGNGDLKVVYASGANRTVSMSNADVSITQTNGTAVNMSPTNYGANQKYTENLKVTYEGATVNYDIEITNQITGISVKTNPKVIYNVNETLDLTNGEILVTRASGTPEAISMGDANVEVTGFNSAAEATGQTLTVKYTENGVSKTTTFTVDIKDSVTAISIDGTPKTSYNYGEELESLTISVTKGSGTTKVPVTSNMISGYDKNALGNQTVTITYGGQTASYQVTVNDYVDHIEVQAPTKTTYNYGENLDLTGGTVKEIMASGTPTTPVDLTNSDVQVTGYKPNQLGTQKLTVTYNGKSETFNVIVTDTISRIDVTAPTSNQTYNYGGSLEVTGATITVNYASGAKPTVVTPTTAMVVEKGTTNAVNMSPQASEFITNQKLTKQVTLTYTENGITGSVDYTIDIVNDIQSIKVQTKPSKTEYNVNETLDLTNGEILVTRATGTPEAISMEDANVEVTGFNSAAEATGQTLTVKYTENGVSKTTTFTVDIKDTVTAISIDGTPKTSYNYGEELESLTISVTKGSGTTKVPVTSNMISGYDKNVLGNQTVTITYGGQTASYQVTVNDYVDHIEVQAPTKTTYNYGENLDLTGGTVKEIMASGTTTTPVDLTNSNVQVTGYKPNQLGTQKLTVTYNGKSETFDVIVTDTISRIDVTAPTSSQTYNYGGSLNVTGATITVNYASGAKPTVVTPTTAMVVEKGTTNAVNMSPQASEFITNQKLTKQVTLTYTENGITGSVDYTIDIVNDIQSIKVQTKPSKTEYNVNETLDLSNGEILVTRATGTPEVISMEDANVEVTGFNSAAEATGQTLTVKYTENGISKTTTFTVDIKDSVTAISIDGTPKTSYNYGEELESLTINVTKGSGTTKVPVTSNMISGYDKNALGNQTVTITYGGQTASYQVTVNDYVDHIEVQAPTKTTYNYGENLDLTGGTVKEIMASGTPTTPVDLTNSDVQVTGYKPNQLGTQKLTVTYNGKSETFDVIVTDTISRIDVTAPTSNQTYNYGGRLDVTGATITVNYASGEKPTVVTPTTAMVVEKGTKNAVNMSPQANEFTTNQKLTKQVTLTYTENGITGSVDYTIDIVNDIQSIKVQTKPSKTEYNVNETLDLSNGEILVTRATGTPEVISMEDANVEVTGFNSAAEVTGQTLTVKYTENGISKTTTFTVDIKDSVTAISIDGTPKTSYNYGEELESLTINVTKGSGTTKVPVTSNMISGYDKNTLGNQTVTITYGGQTASYQVTVNDYVDHIEVQAPAKTTYNYGENLDLTGGTVKEIMASGTPTTPVDLTNSDVQVTGYNPTTVSVQTITVEYKGKQASFQVEVKDDVSDITLKGTPVIDYEYGDTLDLTGITIEITRPSGKQTVEMTDSKVTVEGYNPNKIGKQTITVKYDGQVVTTYEITTTNPVTKVELGVTPKTSYEVGDSLDVTNGTIIVTRKNNSTETINITQEMVTGFDSSKPANNQTLTVNCTVDGKNYSLTYDVNIIEAITSITIENTPKTNYLYGEPLDITGGTIIAHIASGGQQPINITQEMVTEEDGTPFDSTNLTPRNLKVTYGNKTVTYPITVSDYIVDIELTPPSKVDYHYGDNLDLTGGSVKKIMASGTPTTPIDLNNPNVNITGYDNTKTGNQVLDVNYTEDGKTYTKQFSVTVDDPITNVTLDTTNVTKNYKYGENLDLSKAELVVKHLSGDTKKVTVTTGMISGYNPNTLGSQTVTVSYLDTTHTFQVNVEDYVVDIRLTPPSKVEYQYGQTLELTNGSITEVMASGATGNTVSLADNMVTGFDSTTPGTKTITVTYSKEGATFQKQFQVIVYNDVQRIEVLPPTKTDYKYGENLNLVGAKVKIIREDGTEEYVSITKDMITGYSPTTSGRQVIDVTYQDEKQNVFKGHFTVNVGEDYVKDYVFTSPTKKTYDIGEQLDLTGGKITEVYASGKHGIVTELTADMITGFDSTTPGTKKITVTYESKQYSYQVTIKDKILGIIIENYPNKLEYQKGENLDLTGATLKVIKQSGTKEVQITKNMVSGYDKNKVGMQSITVTYEGFTTTFVVNVQKPIVPPDNNNNNNQGTNGNNQNNNNNNTNNNNTNNNTNNNNSTNNNNNQTINNNDNIQNEVQEPIKPEEPTVPVIPGTVDDNNTPNPPSGNTAGSWLTVQMARYILASIAGLVTLCLILLVASKFKKNVEIYIEEGEERVLVGKARITQDNRVLDLSKYCDKYNEEKYKVYVTETGTKKLDNKKLEVIIKDKVETFKVKYNEDGQEYNV